MKKTCKDCIWFSCENSLPILDECICFFPGGGKNYFVDMEPCENFAEDDTQCPC